MVQPVLTLKELSTNLYEGKTVFRTVRLLFAILVRFPPLISPSCQPDLDAFRRRHHPSHRAYLYTHWLLAQFSGLMIDVIPHRTSLPSRKAHAQRRDPLRGALGHLSRGICVPRKWYTMIGGHENRWCVASDVKATLNTDIRGRLASLRMFVPSTFRTTQFDRVLRKLIA